MEMKSDLNALPGILSGIHQHAGVRRIITNIGWLLMDHLLALMGGLLVGAWVARYLGPTQYGLFSYAVTFEALFVPIAGLGLARIVVRELVRTPEDKSKILGTAFILQFGASVLTFAITIAAAYLLRPNDAFVRRLIAIVAGQLVFRAFSNTIDDWFRSQVQSKYVVWSRNTAMVLIALAKIVLILREAKLVFFVWATLAQVILFTVLVAAFYHTTGQRVSAWRGSVVRARELVRDGWPLIISGLAIVIYMRIGQFMLGTMVGAEALGIYSAAIRLSQLWYFIPTAVAASVFPMIVRSRDDESEQVYHKRLQMFYDFMSGLAYVIVIPCALLAVPLVRLLFGPEYADAGPILAVHIWTFIFVSLGVARSQWLVAENMTSFSMIATIVGAVFSVGLNYLLIPRYGGLGAAWAALLSQMVSAYLSSLFSARTRPMFGPLSLSLLLPFRLGSLWRSFRDFALETL